MKQLKTKLLIWLLSRLMGSTETRKEGFYWLIAHDDMMRHITSRLDHHGMKAGQINNVRSCFGHKPFVGYMRRQNGETVFFTQHPTPERRNELGGRYTIVS